ncbi:MAG: alpha/beta fold hydrolase [Acidimicrobiales bacterium]|nr:alpha/beta fold hydrolase [Acidimicrobiales bacterium]
MSSESNIIDAEAADASILDELGVAEEVLGLVDPVAFLRSILGTLLKACSHPIELAGAGANLAFGAIAAAPVVVGRAAGMDVEGPMQPSAKDRRFADPEWESNPIFYGILQAYLLQEQLVHDVVDAARLSPDDDRKARFISQFLVDALAPTNFLPTNPKALRRAVETGGKSVVSGVRNLIGDIRHNGGWPSQVDASPFEVGVNMAASPGKVVYRSDLIELIQYEPATRRVYETPLLFCPPWINKYYIMDLAPGKSLIEWAVAHGHTCFAISYRNPDESMRNTGFEDYLRQGPLDAVRVVRDITGAEKVNTLNVCLGGTLTAMAMAYGAAAGDEPINTATFLNTLTDFSDPGILGAFTDESTVRALEKKMAKRGFLEAGEMARTFDAIRANDLIFSYVESNWLLGEKPPAFDLLAWNADSTRMPARMHGTYLRRCYLQNDFASGRMDIDGVPIEPGKVEQDVYVLSAVDDHIVPWTSAYRTARLLGGDARFVLSTAGHIAGIVNPPSPKAKHWVNDSGDLPEDPHLWREGSTLVDRTWWEDWIAWVSERAGAKVAPPRGCGSAEFPPLYDAPGQYVHGRS